MQQLDPQDLILLEVLSDGETIVSAAPRFNVTPGTLKQRVHRLREKFGADTTTQMVAMALRRRIIE